MIVIIVALRLIIKTLTLAILTESKICHWCQQSLMLNYSTKSQNDTRMEQLNSSFTQQRILIVSSRSSKSHSMLRKLFLSSFVVQSNSSLLDPRWSSTSSFHRWYSAFAVSVVFCTSLQNIPQINNIQWSGVIYWTYRLDMSQKWTPNFYSAETGDKTGLFIPHSFATRWSMIQWSDTWSNDEKRQKALNTKDAPYPY